MLLRPLLSEVVGAAADFKGGRGRGLYEPMARSGDGAAPSGAVDVLTLKPSA
jgi:hypothetical protein